MMELWSAIVSLGGIEWLKLLLMLLVVTVIMVSFGNIAEADDSLSQTLGAIFLAAAVPVWLLLVFEVVFRAYGLLLEWMIRFGQGG